MTDRVADRTDSSMPALCDSEAILPDVSALAEHPRLRIAINAITEPAPRFGSRVYLWELASALAGMDGVDLALLVGQGQANEVPPMLRSYAREMAVSPGRSYAQIFRQKRIRETLLRYKIDCYHLPNTIPLLGKGMPTVITIHDLVDVRVKKYGVARTGYRFLVNFVAAHLADRVITVSENSKRDIVRLLRIPESKVTVIHNGVAEEFRPLDRRDCKDYLASKYSITGDFLLAPGGISRNKNIPGLLNAIRLLQETGRQEALVILGDTESPEFQHVALSIRRSGLDGTVMVPGFVPREELPVFYNAASLVVYPALYEGFGLPVLEAMACGTPIVASNTSSLPEVAGGAALLVDPRNPGEIAGAVQRLLSDETLREELSSRGILHARQFTWKKTAEKTLEVFLEVATNNKRFRNRCVKGLL
jgi:glycosyltransferase involved in cell wall biosynthesis